MKVASRGSDQFSLRLPDGLRDRIKEVAEENGRSMNSELIYRLTRIYSAAATEGQIGVGSSAAASSNNGALPGAASITNG